MSDCRNNADWGGSRFAGQDLKPGVGSLSDGRLTGHTQHQHLITAGRGGARDRKRHGARPIRGDMKRADFLLIPENIRIAVWVKARYGDGHDCANRSSHRA